MFKTKCRRCDKPIEVNRLSWNNSCNECKKLARTRAWQRQNAKLYGKHNKNGTQSNGMMLMPKPHVPRGPIEIKNHEHAQEIINQEALLILEFIKAQTGNGRINFLESQILWKYLHFKELKLGVKMFYNPDDLINL